MPLRLKKFKTSLLFITLALLTTNLSAADQGEDDLWQEDLWDNESGKAQPAWTGFVEYGYGHRLSNDPLFSKQQTLNEARLHLQKDWDLESVSFDFQGDLGYDQVLSEFIGEVRELNLNFSLAGNTDFKIGRQIITWGTGDLLFLNDLFAKDWNAYFNGRDDVYLKKASDSIRLTSYFDWLNLDFVWTPEFTPDNYIDGERFSFFSPLAGENIGGSDLVNPQEPKHKFSNGEFALRLYKNYQGYEFALYGYKGFDKQPVGFSQDFRPTFYKRNAYGASVRGSLAGGIFNIEVVRENALEDPSGADPLVKNSLSKWLLGYESEWAPKLSVAFQYYVEKVHDHKALVSNSFSPEFESSEYLEWLTNRVTYSAMQDKLSLNLFSFYSLTDKEYFLRWNINYRQDDHWSYTFGINQIDGEQTNTFFAQFEKASNAYFRVRYTF